MPPNLALQSDSRAIVGALGALYMMWLQLNANVSHARAMTRSLGQLSEQTLQSASFNGDTKEWVFVFSGGVGLRVSAPWRIVAHGQIALGWQDDGHSFGLQMPIDATERLGALIHGRRIASASVSLSGDLAIDFGGDSTLEIFNASCGYEGWQLQGPGQRWTIAQGGGNVLESDHDG